MNALKRFGIDGYMLCLIAVVVLGAVLPVSGIAARGLGWVTVGAIALLFLLYGAKLDSASVRAGLLNWRLQIAVFLVTFAAIPLLGWGIASAMAPVLGASLALGILFLAVLPSTVQSSIAFTAMAGGDVPAAICAATISNVAGVFLTPLFVAFLLHQQGGGIEGTAIVKIFVQIILPFAVGQILRPVIGDFVRRHKTLTMTVDRGSILLIVYAAFSAGTVAGLWQAIPPMQLGVLALVIAVFLALVIAGTMLSARAAGMAHPAASVLLFCGSTKSLASGLPMAAALFAPERLSAIVLPLMLYHLMQLFTCALIAQRRAYCGAMSESLGK